MLTQEQKARKNAQAKARHDANPEKKKAQARARYDADPEKEKARHRASYAADPEKKKAQARARYAANLEKEKARRAGYAEKKKAHNKKNRTATRTMNFLRAAHAIQQLSRHP